MLEYFCPLIGIWIDLLEGSIAKQDCILTNKDSSIAIGWLRRVSNKVDDKTIIDINVKEIIAKKLATTILESETVLYQQWFAGEHNTVADSLSRDAAYLDKISHTYFLLSFLGK